MRGYGEGSVGSGRNYVAGTAELHFPLIAPVEVGVDRRSGMGRGAGEGGGEGLRSICQIEFAVRQNKETALQHDGRDWYSDKLYG